MRERWEFYTSFSQYSPLWYSRKEIKILSDSEMISDATPVWDRENCGTDFTQISAGRSKVPGLLSRGCSCPSCLPMSWPLHALCPLSLSHPQAAGEPQGPEGLSPLTPLSSPQHSKIILVSSRHPTPQSSKTVFLKLCFLSFTMLAV